MTRRGEPPLDLWSLVHVNTGLFLGLFALPWWAVLVVLVAYEVLEAGLRRIKLEEGGLFEFESWPNIAVDVAVGMGGWLIGWWLGPLPGLPWLD